MVSLKGRVGRGSSRRRFSRRRPSANNQFWYARDTETLAGPVPVTYSDAQLIWSWNPGASSSEQFMQKLRLLRIQGCIPVFATMKPEDQADVNLPGGAQRADGPIRMFFWWSKQDSNNSGASSSVPSPTNQNPIPSVATYPSGGDLQYILTRTDVLKWGFVDVPIHTLKPRVQITDMVTGTSDYASSLSSYYTEPPGARSYAFIPIPKIGPMGMTLDRGSILSCYGRAVRFNQFSGTWENINDQEQLVSVWYDVLLRLRLAR